MVGVGRGSIAEAHGREKKETKKNHFETQTVYLEDKNTEKNPGRLEYWLLSKELKVHGPPNGSPRKAILLREKRIKQRCPLWRLNGEEKEARGEIYDPAG